MSMWNKSIGIIGTGKFLPDNIVTNKDIEKMVDTSDEWIRERTGIEARCIAPEGLNTSDMAVEAAKAAIADASLSVDDIDCIIVATMTPDMNIPSTACLVQAKLGADKAAGFDLHIACSGYIYSLITAASYINSGLFKNVLVIGAEIMSRVLNWKDRSTCILFGDGAGACIVSEVPEGYGMLSMDMGINGGAGMNLTIPASGVAMIPTDARATEGLTYLHMNGPEVYKFAVRTMGKTVINALDKIHLTVEDLDFFIPHQANKRIIDSAAHRLKLPAEKVFINLPKYGNTTAASIAIALDEALHSGLIKRGDIVAMAGFGAGLSWGSLIAKWY